VEIEWHLLNMKYAALRIEDPARQAKVVASIAQHGQESAVLVVREGGGFVLIDGYARARGLKVLGRDTVVAVELPMTATEALVFCHKLVSARRHTALEDGWLVRELVESHGMSQRTVACRLSRSTSWVSRRLALVRELPAVVQERVRAGEVCPYAAMKYLVPLARANVAECVTLTRNVAGHGLSARQLGELYEAWRRSDPAVRKRLVEEPLLFLRATEAVVGPQPPDEGTELLRDIEVVGGVSRRARHRLRKVMVVVDARLTGTWQETQRAFDLLCAAMEERIDAGQGDTAGDSAAQGEGPRAAGDREGRGGIAELGEASP
jgi:ParB-like chromosome segregation protein Spo0J